MEIEALTPALLAWIAVVMVAAGFVQGALGLGFPTLATPLIALVSDIRTAVIMVLLPCIATVLVSTVRSGFLRQALTDSAALALLVILPNVLFLMAWLLSTGRRLLQLQISSN